MATAPSRKDPIRELAEKLNAKIQEQAKKMTPADLRKANAGFDALVSKVRASRRGPSGTR